MIEGTTETYDKQEFDLTKTEEVKHLLDKVILDIAALEFQLSETTESTDWHRTKKVNPMLLKIEEMQNNGQTETDDYKEQKLNLIFKIPNSSKWIKTS